MRVDPASWGAPVALCETPGAIAPTLIRVPAVRVPIRRPVSGKVRRRLRREVRAVGYLLAAGIPLALTLPSGLPRGTDPGAVGLRAPAASAASPGAHRAERPPVVSLSIEPFTAAASSGAGASVSLPGYLLPDDGPEESAHGGS